MTSFILPGLLVGRSFLRSDAAALGVYDAELRRKNLAHPTHGVWTTQDIEGLDDLARAVLPVVPAGAAFSHLTAAQFHGLPLPFVVTRQPLLHVMTPSSIAVRRREGWRGHRGAESRRIVLLGSLPVTDLVDTWIDLAALAAEPHPSLSLDDLVVAGDQVLNCLLRETDPRMPHTSPRRPWLEPGRVDAALAILDDRLTQRPIARGAVLLREARSLVRPGVRSPQETRARLLFRRAGLPEPEINVDIECAGVWVAESDLVWRKEGVAGEYQGAVHADRRKRSEDAARLAAIRDAGFVVHEIWAEDLHQPARRRMLLERLGASLGVRPRYSEAA